MFKIKDYTIVTDVFCDQFAKQVNQLLDEGWTPNGPLIRGDGWCREMVKLEEVSPAEELEPEVCSCGDWEKGVKRINDIMLFSSVQSAAPVFQGPTFRFCPWCGKQSREY